jgi:hypothetical protein
MRELVPPPFAGPFSALQDLQIVAGLVCVQQSRSAESKYHEERIVVEDVDDGAA